MPLSVFMDHYTELPMWKEKFTDHKSAIYKLFEIEDLFVKKKSMWGYHGKLGEKEKQGFF